MKNEDQIISEMKAYKVGYDLGWYRAYENISNDLSEILDGMLNSATFKEFAEAQGDSMPIFIGKIISIKENIKQQRDENLPLLLAERETISKLGKAISLLPNSAFEISLPERDKLTTNQLKEIK